MDTNASSRTSTFCLARPSALARALALPSLFLFWLGFGCTGEVGSAGTGESAEACSCEGRECGDDSCGGSCGSCAEGVACNPVLGVCADQCGNGVIDSGETCDPPAACPADCDDGEACTTDTLQGTAESCSLECLHTAVTECAGGDGCCASGCTAIDDADCDPVCGNGVLEAGETCNDGGEACPSVCEDDDLCTEDVLVGSEETCDAACEYRPIDPCNLDSARGVQLGTISIDQGIRVPIREDGQIIELESRVVPIVARRPMLVRADWVLDDPATFEARDIRAVLNLYYGDGSSDAVEDIKETGDRSEFTYDDFNDAYFWRLSGDQVQPDMQLSIELYEVDDSFRQEPAPLTSPRFPAESESTFELGVGDTLMDLEVVLVPFDHDLGPDCPEPPDITAVIERDGVALPEYEYYAQRLMAQNPTENVTVIPHDVVAFTGSAESSSDIFTALRQLREENDADPWQFYYGVINPCDDGPSFSGVASVPSHGDDGLPDMNDGNRRTGWGRYRDEGRHAGTCVHEIGHEQGRLHVVCGGPENPDPDYPNDTGDIGAYGWDIFNDDFAQPDDKDYMSYCSPRWISVYGWNLTFPWIAEVSRWPAEQQWSSIEPTRVLYATIQPDGQTDWWTGRIDGPWRGQASPHRLAFYAGTRLLGEAVAQEEEVHKHPGAFFLAAPVPQGWAQVTTVVWSDGFSQYVVPRPAIREIR